MHQNHNHNHPDTDRELMQRALDLARKGEGNVSPNPMVGALLTADGRIIGEGYHQQFGGPHAEVNAIAAVTDPALLTRATLYVTLEPCVHHGKTPPCCDLIISKKIPRVIVGCLDPNPAVAGKGIRKLRDAGIEVITGLLDTECRHCNRAFIATHTRNRPWLTLKTAQTLDGRIATTTGASHWITGPESRREVHRLRSIHDAILTTATTALADNSRLTLRDHPGRQPLRIVLDRTLRLPLTAPLFSNEAPTLLFTATGNLDHPHARQLIQRGTEVHAVPLSQGGLNLHAILATLHQRGLISVMVEAGGTLAAALIRQQLVDQLTLFIAPTLIGGDGLASIDTLGITHPDQAIRFTLAPPHFFGCDIRLEAYIHYNSNQQEPNS